MNEKLTLNDGTELHGHQVETEIRLFLYLYDITLTDAFPLLNDPAKTSVISWTQYGETGEVKGYNHLVSVSEEMGGMICASLKKV